MSLSFNYQVPYIQQQRQMSCWLTALQMVDHWQFIKSIGNGVWDPEWVAMSVRYCEVFQRIGRASKPMRKKLLQSAPLFSSDAGNYPNTGVTRSEMVAYGHAAGMTSVEWEKTGQDLAGLYDLLKEFGPLLSAGHFMNGQPHAIVVTGVLEADLPYPDFLSETASEWVIYSDPIRGPGARISMEDFAGCFFLLNEPGVMMGRK